MSSEHLLKRTGQFVDYLANNGWKVSDTGRINICPVCGKEGSASLKDGKIKCFHTSCRLAAEGLLEIEEFVYFFGGDDDKELIDLSEVKIKEIKDIDVDVRTNSLIYSEAIDFFHDELLSDKKALDHLLGRGRTLDSIKHFKVGVVKSVEKLYNRISNKYSIDQLEDCGLFKFNDDGFKSVRLIYNSYTYPIYWKGRVRNIKSKIGKDSCYIGSRYTGKFPLFFNQEAIKGGEVFIVEGENDVMRLWELDKKNTLGMLGQPSSGQIQYLKSQKEEKIYSLLFDNDDAGEIYTRDFIKEFSSVKKHDVYVVPYDGDDPDVGTNFKWEGVSKSFVEQEIKKENEESASTQFAHLDDKYIKILVSGKVRIIMKDRMMNNWMDWSNFCRFEPTENWILEKWSNQTKCYIDTCVDFANPGKSYVSLNLFTGYSVKPLDSNKDIRLIYKHIKDVLCSGDLTAYNYFLDWIAHMLQKPQEIVGTAPVFIGEQGGGKGVIIENLLGRIVGRDHFLATGHAENYTDKFNSQLEGKLLINIDEASFSGNHGEISVLKRLIGNESILVTRKGLEGYTTDNRARLIFSSNHNQPVKVEKSNRRYFVLETSDDWVYTSKKHTPEEIKKYFNLLTKLIDDGAEQFLYDMLSRPIDGFNRFQAPETSKEQELKAEAVSGVEDWFYACLFDRISDEYNWMKDVNLKTHGKIKSSDLIDLYSKYNSHDKYMTSTKFGREIGQLFGVKSKPFKIGSDVYRGWVISNQDIKELMDRYHIYNI